jgi:hypothetical protein
MKCGDVNYPMKMCFRSQSHFCVAYIITSHAFWEELPYYIGRLDFSLDTYPFHEENPGQIEGAGAKSLCNDRHTP